MERVTCAGLPNCLRLSNDRIEVVVPTTIGPRIMRCGFLGGPNLLGEYPQLATNTPLGEWKPWGGHRLWAAPEQMPGSYVQTTHRYSGSFATIVRCSCARTRCLRFGEITRDSSAAQRQQPLDRTRDPQSELLANRDRGWGVDRRLAWRDRVAAAAGISKPRRAVTAGRAMALWSFTNMTDRRWRFGTLHHADT